jgi:hypothetical protein
MKMGGMLLTIHNIYNALAAEIGVDELGPLES